MENTLHLHLPVHSGWGSAVQAPLMSGAGWTMQKKSIEFSVVFSHFVSFLGQIPGFHEKCPLAF